MEKIYPQEVYNLSFISAIFNREVLRVTLKPTEPPTETTKQKKMSFDVSVEFDDGEISDLEMQARNQGYDYGVRAEIQAARLLTNNAKRGKKWKSQKVYQISILNFQYKNDDNKEMRCYTMRDNSGSTLAERLNVIFIDLVSIRQKYGTPVKELTPIEKWGLFFSYVDKKNKADYVNNIVRSEKGLMAAETIVRHMSKADANWFTQNSIWIAERDAYSAREAQLDRVREESLEKGRNEKAVESAKEFLKEGISPEIIAKCVKLPLEEVLKLQK